MMFVMLSFSFFCFLFFCGDVCSGNGTAQWHVDQVRHVTPDMCTGNNKHVINRTFSGDLCNFAVGAPMYQTIEWIDYEYVC